MSVVTLERMESTSSGGAWTPGAAAREQWTDGSGRWRGASRGEAEAREGRRSGSGHFWSARSCVGSRRQELGSMILYF
jgi:hypothetical protein